MGVPVTEIVQIAATCFERVVDFRHLPLVIRQETMATVKGEGAGAAQIDDDTILA